MPQEKSNYRWFVVVVFFFFMLLHQTDKLMIGSLQVQIAMQRENQVFTSVSNVLKTRHDTVKNSISNIR